MIIPILKIIELIFSLKYAEFFLYTCAYIAPCERIINVDFYSGHTFPYTYISTDFLYFSILDGLFCACVRLFFDWLVC